MQIRGTGPCNAKIMILGECAGEADEKTGIPLSGAGGYLLNEMLMHAGINRRDCYVTNVINVRPPNGEFSSFYLDAKARTPTRVLTMALEELKIEIGKVNPNIIICLGNEALFALTGYTSVDKWRGSILMSEFGKVIPTYHPSTILRAYEKRCIVETDLKKARYQSNFKEMPVIKHNFIIEPSFETVMDFIHSNPEKVAFDIETTGEHTRCIGFASSETDAICIPITKNNQSYWPIEVEYAILKELDIFFRNDKIKKIGQNFPFDSTVLAVDFGFDIQGLIMDTMIAQHTCYSEMPKSLDFLASMYTNVPYWKDYNPSDDISTWVYNCWDCIVTYQVYLKLKQELLDLNVYDFYMNHCQPLMLALVKAGNRGILIDQEYRNSLKAETEAKIISIEQQLEEILNA